MQDKVRDLRSALKRLKQMEGQYIETDVEVDPMAEPVSYTHLTLPTTPYV